MSSQLVPIHRSTDKNDTWFNAFDFVPGQDEHIRWLSRPNQDLIRDKHSSDSEKFRITFDVENFQADQIKIYIQNRKLTISGVYEEHSEGRHMQKQFERTFDIPSNADVEAMASFITPAHMLVVEIPLHASHQLDQLSVAKSLNDQRRQSFSLNKFNTSDQGSLGAPSQQVRRSSVTKTTTTTRTTGSQALPAEAQELLRNAETSTGGNSQTFTTHSTERRSSNTGQQPVAHQDLNNSTSNQRTTLTTTDLANLPIEIPPELLASGGTITIQRRKVSVTKSGDTHTDHGVAVPITPTHNDQSTSHSNSLGTTSNTSERRGSKTISSSNQSRMLTMEEFLQNKTWNPSLVDGPNGKKILRMRLQMKSGTTSDQMKISLNGHDLRVEVNNKASPENGRSMNEHSYRQITLFPTCEVEHLKTEFKDDGYLHVEVPIKL